MILARRGFITGLGASMIASPAIVRASSLMAIKPIAEDYIWLDERSGRMYRTIADFRQGGIDLEVYWHEMTFIPSPAGVAAHLDRHQASFERILNDRH